MTQELGPLQTEWLAALESGEFEQATGCLCKSVGDHLCYCCLGVACVIADRHGAELRRHPVGAHRVDLDVGGDSRGSSLPVDVKNLFKFRSSNGTSSDGKLASSLDRLNDAGHTFKEIASLVRKNPERYFIKPA